jgi:uncharacterized SAM-dependent methyltransferase
MAVGTKIIDIRVDTALSDIVADIKTGLRPADGGEKKLPTMLLYSEAGLKLFEKITYLDEVRRREAHSLPPHFLIVQ